MVKQLTITHKKFAHTSLVVRLQIVQWINYWTDIGTLFVHIIATYILYELGHYVNSEN